MTDDRDATEAEAAVEQPPKFTEWMAKHREGLLDIDLAEAFGEVVEAVSRTGKAGNVTLTLKVSREGGDMIAVVEEVKAKVPEIVEPKLYFRGFDGQLTRNNPSYPEPLV